MSADVGKKTTVCIYNPNLRTFGGGEKHMAYFCKFFEECFCGNVQIDILAPYTKKKEEAARTPVQQEAINSHFGMNLTSVREISLDLVNSFNPLAKIKKLLVVEDFSKNYDFFVNFNFMSVDRGRAKYNIYSCMFPPKKNKEKNLIKRIGKRLLFFNFYKSYDIFISNSCFTNQWLGKRWPKVKRSMVVYPPCFDSADLKGRYDEKQKKNIILSVGRFFVDWHNKRQVEMIQFFMNGKDKFENFEYHLVGNVQSDNPKDLEYLKEVKNLAAKAGNVFVHENCPYSELVDLYKKAKIFWHATGYGISEEDEPEKMEHFGITTVEAMSYGAVPVVIDKAGQKEIVEQGVTGFKWLTEEECVGFTAKLASDDGLRKAMAKKASASLEPFSYEAFYKKMKSVVEMASR